MKGNIYKFLIFSSLSYSIFNIGWSQQLIKLNQSYINFNNSNLLNKYIKDNAHKEKQYYFIKTQEIINPQSTVSNYKILGYYGEHIYAIEFNNNSTNNALQQLKIVSWAPITAGDKISPYFNTLQDEKAAFKALISTIADDETFQEIVEKNGGTLSIDQPFKGQQLWQVDITINALQRIADHPLIGYISPYHPDQNLNKDAINATNTRMVNQSGNLGGYGLLGTGITVGVGDDSHPIHLDYDKRMKNFNPFHYTLHGYHTTGTVAGAGLIDERYRGFAPKANLVSDFYSAIVGNAEQYAQQLNMYLTNNSYAAIVGNCSYAGTYDGTSQFIDNQLFNNPKLLHVFAAGNDGNKSCTPYPTGYGTVVGAYQTAKNAIVVGSINKNANSEHTGSSKGPIQDGRLKPEIVANGLNLVSTAAANNYASQNGTSMATPNVTGAAALLQEAYKNIHNDLPDNALLKNALMNGADDVGRPGPDFYAGYGVLNTKNSVDIIQQNQYFTNTITHNGQQQFQINVPNDVTALKVMITWTDPAAMPGSASQLVNDLDMNITANGQQYLPLVLNPNYGNVLDYAQPGIDHTNNSEQIVIQNPTAGNYTVNVTGFNVPFGPQKYYITYQFQQKGVRIKGPNADQKLIANIAEFLSWDAPPQAGPFKVEYSLDNGGAWTTIADNLADSVRAVSWTPPNSIASTTVQWRVTGNGLNGGTATSNTLTVLRRITPVLTTNQCPGNISLTWNAVPNIDKYYAYIINDSSVNLVDSTLTNNYTFKNLHPNTTYWVAIAPVKNGMVGTRSVAQPYIPNTGNCAGINNGDVAIHSIISPQFGRSATSNDLNNATFKLQVANQQAQSVNDFTIYYNINNAGWQQQSFTQTLAPATLNEVLVSSITINQFGNIPIQFVIKNNSQVDTISQNDTLDYVIKNMPNPIINIVSGSIEEDYETTSFDVTEQSVYGFTTAQQWDYIHSANARVRSQVLSNITIEGNRSISLDRKKARGNFTQSENQVIGTFNLSNYTIANKDIRFDLDYKLHNVPQDMTNNAIFIRGNDQAPWIRVKEYDTLQIGSVKNSGSLSLAEFLAANGQNYSSSTQIKIAQQDTTLISGNNVGTGLTIDNFKMYEVNDDIEVIALEDFETFNCGAVTNIPIKVKVTNRMLNTMTQIPISYQIDNQNPVTELIPSINGKDTIIYTFNQLYSDQTLGAHTLKIWVNVASDNYRQNDSIIPQNFNIQPNIIQYPYLEQFEDNNGYYYTDGQNSSWAHGAINGFSFNKAANGTKGWKTNLNGNYNPNEYSYLYSPCFDLSTLARPMLSFSLGMQIESQESDTTYFDAAWMEYSLDGGKNWEKLGQAGNGVHWYENPNLNVWANSAQNYWRVASYELPNVPKINFRWVLKSDPGMEYDGIALDDIHIFDYQHPIADMDSLSKIYNATVSSNQTENVMLQNEIIGTITNPTNSATNIALQTYRLDSIITPDEQQYVLPRNFVLKNNNSSPKQLNYKLYLKHDWFENIRNDQNCPSCSKPNTIYDLGITHYSDASIAVLNQTFSDDTNGAFSYLHHDSVQWIPYANGYYAQFNGTNEGEYWFNDGGATKNNPAPLNNLTFDAFKINDSLVQLNWANKADTVTYFYEIQSAGFDGNYSTVARIFSNEVNEQVYEYVDTPRLDAPFRKYRIRYQLKNGKVFYSVIKTLTWDTLPTLVNIYPNPVVKDGNLYISYFKNDLESITYKIIDSHGKHITTQTVPLSKYKDSVIIYLKDFHLSSGMYIFTIETSYQSWTHKIIYLP